MLNIYGEYTPALDKLLKCDMYDIREGHYRIPDYGCVYAPINENILGNADMSRPKIS